MTKSKFRFFTIIDIIISLTGLAICILSAYWLSLGVSFGVLMFSGTFGTILIVLGTSMLVDQMKFKAMLKKQNIPFKD